MRQTGGVMVVLLDGAMVLYGLSVGGKLLKKVFVLIQSEAHTLGKAIMELHTLRREAIMS
jgi:hypothetical protein